MESGSRADHGSNVTPLVVPGHESHGGVHVCNKCGWPFPNPYPNARHRRAHRKICGTVPGYSLLPQPENTGLSPVSDDGQLSDEDLKTPSPKVVERSHFAMSSGGPGGMSMKSEDDVFSDAVDDFSDTGSTTGFQPRLEEVFNVTIDNKDTSNVESCEEAIGGGASDETTQMQISEVKPDTITPASEEYVPFAKTDLTEKEPGDESANTGGVLMSDLNPMISGNQMNDSGEVAKNNANDLDNTFQKGNDHITAEAHVLDSLVSPGGNASVDLPGGMPNTEKAVVVNSSIEPNFGISELDEEHTAKVDEVPQLKEEFHEKIETRSSLDDMKSTNHTNASVDMVEVKVDALVAPVSAGSSESVEGVNCMDNENAHVLSVHDDIKYVDNAEAMIEGFKGEGSKFLQTVNLGSDGITNDAKDSGSAVDDDCSSSPTRQLVEGTPSTASEVQVLGDSPEMKDDENAHVISVHDDTKYADSAEAMIEGFKGEGSKFLQAVSLCSDGTTNDVKDSGSAMDDDFSSSPTSQLVDGTLSTASEVQVLGDSPEVKDESSSLIENYVGSSAEVLSDMNQKVPSGDTEAEQLKKPADTHSGTYEVPNNQGSDVGDNSKTTILEPHEEDDQEASEPDNIIFEKERLHGQLDRPDVTGAENSAPSSLVDQNVSMKTEESFEPDIEHTQTGASKQGIQEAKTIESNLLEVVNATDCQEETIQRDVTPAAETGDSVSGSAMEKSSVESKVMLESTDVHQSSTITDKSVNATERQLKEEPAAETGTSVAGLVMENSSVESKAMLEPAGVHESSTIKDKSELATETQLKEESACISTSQVSNNEASFEKLEAESTLGVAGTTKLDESEHAEVLQKSSLDPVSNDLVPSSDSDSLKATVAKDDCTGDLVGDASHDKSEPFGKEGDSSTKQLGTSAADFSVDSNSQTDSLEGHWGSVSVLSTQSDMPVSTAKTNAAQDSDKTDMFEAPSFMTLVEPRTANDQKAAGASSEIHSAQNPQHSKAQAGWFPSITNVVNESQGRKKNEEIIAKVTNWSNTGKQHTPLKSLLGEANQEMKSRSSPSHVKENAAAGADKGRDNGVRSSTIQEEGVGRKEWNSPARYPAEIKREKRKEKGRPYWAHLVCCASVN